MKNMLKKMFNWSEVHLSEMTCYKIHTLVKIMKLETPQPILPCLSLTYLGGNWSPLCVQMHLYCCLEMAKHGSVRFGLNCKLVLVKRAPILAYLTKNLIKRRAQILFFLSLIKYDIGRFWVFFVQKWKNMISRAGLL